MTWYRKWSRWRTWKRLFSVAVGSTLGIAVLYVIARILEGVAGNRADDWFGKPLVKWLEEPVPAPRYFVLLVAFLVIGVCIDRFFQVNEEKAKRERSQNVVELNLTAQTAIAKMTSEIDDLDDNVERTLQKLLEDVVASFPNQTFRAAILRPDKKKRFLEVWQHIGMDEARLPNGCFCIVNPRNSEDQPGVAGTAWKKRTPQFAQVWKENNVEVSDHPDFVPTREGSGPVTYQAIAQIPLIGPNLRPLGVLTCDSTRRGTFEDPVDREMLVNMGATISRTIVVYHALRKVRGELRSLKGVSSTAQAGSRPNSLDRNGTRTSVQPDVSVLSSEGNISNAGDRARFTTDTRRPAGRVRRTPLGGGPE